MILFEIPVTAVIGSHQIRTKFYPKPFIFTFDTYIPQPKMYRYQLHRNVFVIKHKAYLNQYFIRRGKRTNITWAFKVKAFDDWVISPPPDTVYAAAGSLSVPLCVIYVTGMIKTGH